MTDFNALIAAKAAAAKDYAAKEAAVIAARKAWRDALLTWGITEPVRSIPRKIQYKTAPKGTDIPAFDPTVSTTAGGIALPDLASLATALQTSVKAMHASWTTWEAASDALDTAANAVGAI